ncbi:hypothetical protein ACWGR4_42495 [Embleya sp. NPDC055664]
MTTPEKAGALGGTVPNDDPSNVRKSAERLAADLTSVNRQLLSLGSETRQLVRSLALRPGRDNNRLLIVGAVGVEGEVVEGARPGPGLRRRRGRG